MAFLCFALLCFALLCYDLIGFALLLLCFAVLPCALLCFLVLCFALLPRLVAVGIRRGALLHPRLRVPNTRSPRCRKRSRVENDHDRHPLHSMVFNGLVQTTAT